MPRMTPSIVVALASLALTGCGGPRSLMAVRESGENALVRSDYNRALSDFVEYVQRNPGDTKGRYLLGKAYLGLDRYKDAREQLEIAYTGNLENDDVFDALCEALYGDRKNEELFRLLRQRTTDRGSVKDFIRLADFSQRTGDADGAQQALLYAAKLDAGQTVAPQLALADFYASVGNDADALIRLRMAYYINSSNTIVNERLVQRGQTLGPALALPPPELPAPPVFKPTPGAP